MKKIILFSVIFICFFLQNVLSQVTVALADFKNQTGTFYLDSWEKSIPEFLKTELSSSKKIIVVERHQLEGVLKEQALSMTGLVDSSTAQKVGDLLGAQFIINGTINRSSNWLRIDAKIIRVSTGQVKSEAVRAKDDEHLNEMIQLLGNNIRNSLAGDVSRNDKIELKQYPTTYFLAATAGLTIGAAIANSAFKTRQEEYRDVTELSEFDEKYDAANNLNKTRVVLASLAGAALIGTVYCWIQNMSPDEVLAYNQSNQVSIIPNFAFDQKNRIQAGVTINF